MSDLGIDVTIAKRCINNTISEETVEYLNTRVREVVFSPIKHNDFELVYICFELEVNLYDMNEYIDVG